jgi:hypothetical protein
MDEKTQAALQIFLRQCREDIPEIRAALKEIAESVKLFRNESPARSSRRRKR